MMLSDLETEFYCYYLSDALNHMRTPDWKAKDEHKEHVAHLKEEAMSGWRQKEADFKHFNWTKGDLDPVFDYEMAHSRAHH
uniref:Uncharacterized protein n=1 Tax=Romanomermis culicivorax TaxID=13658 RepID=A0A915JPL6_ROMCU